MDAPVYYPPERFVPPARVPRFLNTTDTTIAELKNIPAAWAIVTKEAPELEALTTYPQLKPQLGNFSFKSLIQFGIVQAGKLDRIDAQLKTLGQVA